MKISCGFLIKNGDEYLIGHSTDVYGSSNMENGWTIFKGMVEENELYIECAVRELREESGINLEVFYTKEQLKQIPIYKTYRVNNDKKVVVFLIEDHSGRIKNIPLKCNSIIPEFNKPEIDAYKWVSAEEARKLVFKGQQILFTL